MGSVIKNREEPGNCSVKDLSYSNGTNKSKAYVACQLRNMLYQKKCFPAERVQELVALANLSNAQVVKYFERGKTLGPVTNADGKSKRVFQYAGAEPAGVAHITGTLQNSTDYYFTNEVVAPVVLYKDMNNPNTSWYKPKNEGKFFDSFAHESIKNRGATEYLVDRWLNENSDTVFNSTAYIDNCNNAVAGPRPYTGSGHGYFNWNNSQNRYDWIYYLEYLRAVFEKQNTLSLTRLAPQGFEYTEAFDSSQAQCSQANAYKATRTRVRYTESSLPDGVGNPWAFAPPLMDRTHEANRCDIGVKFDEYVVWGKLRNGDASNEFNDNSTRDRKSVV
jgi:hypothetical protein